MAITYSYKINQLKKVNSLNSLSDVIVDVDFSYTGVDEDGNQETLPGVAKMPEPTKNGFVPLASLTEAQVIEWVKAHYPVEGMQFMIQQQIDAKKTIVSVIDLPWAPQTTTTTTTVYQGSPTE
jgi:hypothetical protein